MTNSYGIKLGSVGKCAWMFLLLAPACGSTQTGSSNAAVLSGKSPGDAAGGAAAATVSASVIGSDGKLSALVDAPVNVNANGTYALPATVTAGSTGQLLITTKSASAASLGSVVVEGGFAAMGAFKVMPMDANSTAEANLFVNAKSSGQWGADFTFGEMRALIGDDTAAKLGANQADLTARSASALAAVASIAAWRSTLAAEGFTQAQHSATLTKIAVAQGTLDTQLDAATTVAQTDAGAASYLSGFMKAHTDSGATLEQLAGSANATADVTVIYSATLDATLKGNVLANAEGLRAAAVSSAVSAELNVIGSTQVAQAAITSATATLQTQIAAAGQQGAGAQAAIKTAWAAFGTAVNVQLNASLMVAADVTTSVHTAVAADLMTLVTARASITASANVSVAADAESKALVQFMTSVMSHGTLLTAAGVTDARATAYLNAVLAISAAGGAST